MMCESDRGEWGQECPDCGKILPPRPGAMKSWMSSRKVNAQLSENARAATSGFIRIHRTKKPETQ